MTKNRHKLSELPGLLCEPIDLFICQASYENRCWSVAEAFDSSKVKTALIGVNEDIAQHLGSSVERLRSSFKGRAQRVTTKMFDPLITADRWKEALSKHWCNSDGLNVLVDITTFTHESLLILLELIRRSRRPKDKVSLCYASASEYDPGKTTTEKWLSKGVSDIRSVLGFPGNMNPTFKTHLIIMVGYEQERATTLIQSYEPNRLSLGHGKSGTHVDTTHEEAHSRFHELVIEIGRKYGSVESFDFSCTRPEDVKSALLLQVQKYPDFNVVIAPMNTKLSTVGSALAAWENNSIQLCYAQAMSYNYQNYSVPGDSCYLIQDLAWPQQE